MQVYLRPLGELSTNAYLLVNGKTAIAIDAPPGSCEFYSSLVAEKNLEFKHLLLTHSHFDHIADAGKLQTRGIKVGVHPLDSPNCKKPGSDKIPLMNAVDPFIPDFFLDKPQLILHGISFEIIHTPGHSPGGCCFIVEDLIFSGDTLFKGSIGNLSFATGDPSSMSASLKKLASLSLNYTIYPGHGPKTQLENERRNINYFIKTIG